MHPVMLSTSSSPADEPLSTILENAGVPSSVMHLENQGKPVPQSVPSKLESPARVFMVML